MSLKEALIRAEQEAYETEHHLHNQVYIFPQITDADGNAVPDFANPVTITSHVDANRMGAWVKMIDQSNLVSYVYFDPNQFMVIGATLNRLFCIQVGYGDGSQGGTTIKGQATLNTAEKQSREESYEIKCIRVEEDGSSHLYMRCSDDNGGSSFESLIEIHTYLR